MATKPVTKKPCKFLGNGACQATGKTCAATLNGKACPLESGNKLDREIAKHGPSPQRRLDRFQKLGGK